MIWETLLAYPDLGLIACLILLAACFGIAALKPWSKP